MAYLSEHSLLLGGLPEALAASARRCAFRRVRLAHGRADHWHEHRPVSGGRWIGAATDLPVTGTALGQIGSALSQFSSRWSELQVWCGRWRSRRGVCGGTSGLPQAHRDQAEVGGRPKRGSIRR